ncbi:hypothetical protein [Siphonobacter aquaeclarae]|uniref:Uncharacterized protein n=1 Tax=Siphonobacter aquaeclarae TaxID=563176 RepID=A0A1G9T8B6_9BACT|nr:hypothetical protein [Siphonobacter aquaeclarae]SDM43921.1 hypothetical protein SAMN04488090_3455 [Siphonobacter aquaeclarae]
MHNLKKAIGSVLSQVETVEQNPSPENIMILKATVTTLHTVCPEDETENPLFQAVSGAFAPVLKDIVAQFVGDPDEVEITTPDGKVVDFAGAEA